MPRTVEASRGEEQHTWKVMDMKNSAHFEGKNYSQIFCVRLDKYIVIMTLILKMDKAEADTPTYKFYHKIL